jgi:hypothetical protein
VIFFRTFDFFCCSLLSLMSNEAAWMKTHKDTDNFLVTHRPLNTQTERSN